MSGEHRGRRLVALLLAVNLALAGVLAWVGIKRLRAAAPQEEAPTEQQLEMISGGMTGVMYNPEPMMKDGKIAVMLSNASAAGYSVRLELILLEGNETLARTDLIDAGYRLEYLTTKKKLKAGEYPCLLRVELCTPEGKTIGTAGRSLLLKAE